LQRKNAGFTVKLRWLAALPKNSALNGSWHPFCVPKFRINELSSSPAPTTSYRLAGLRIVSALPLLGLQRDDEAASAEVVSIRRAPVPATLPLPVKVVDAAEYDGKAFLFTVMDIARFLIRAGREILVDAETSATESDIRAYLMGSAFGTLCHQRGIVPLHSAAIDVQDGCVAFIGPSGAGKSTLAAVLTARGHQVIADDVSFLQRDGIGAVVSWPGIGRIRLWEDALAALGCNGPGVEREFRGYNKYLVPVRPPADPFSPRRLRGIYHLAVAPVGTAPSVTPVQGASAVEILIQNIYCAAYAECMGRKPAIFNICAALARQVPVFRFSRPMGFDALRDGVEFLEAHMRECMLVS